jgi:asparagine synthase (glutamine-hydrolysing)
MCGICGIYKFNKKTVLEQEIRRMCSVIKHRGPDDEGMYLDGPFGMGIRRLSIIDLESGHQPIANENESVWTVLNGEIYNYEELTADLKNKGHVFKTKSDTEVIVHLYEEFGTDCLKYLRGMFGLALWDVNKRKLLLARDPLGIKQVYFLKSGNEFLFGSEIKCILEQLGYRFQINYEALSHYLTFLYFPDAFTIYEGIEKIRPGHFVILEEGNIIEHEYWSLNNLGAAELDFNQAMKEYMRLMDESIRLHMRSDVPLGVFLSGGIDSSIITALASRFTDKPLNTFTIGYGKEGGFYDERPYARVVAKHFKTNHQEFVVSPNIEETIYKLIHYFDEPFANSSAIPNYYISQAMRKHVKVALSGLGGDEIAAGYERYAGIKMLLGFANYPRILKVLAKNIVNIFPDSKQGNYFSDRCKRFVRALNLPINEAYFSLISGITEANKQHVLSDSYRYGERTSTGLFNAIMNSCHSSDKLRKIMQFDLTSYTTNDLLILTDRTSMANSLEVRVPFLDHKLVEFMYGIPVSYVLRGFQKKYLLQQAFKDILPKQILYRKKRGFSTPLSVWLRSDLRAFALNVLSKDRIEATHALSYDGIQELLKEHLERKANNQAVLFALITFVLWHEMFVQKKRNQY